ncbi:hypothetical protein JCM8208_005488 [Rhodotorula glutinis]
MVMLSWTTRRRTTYDSQVAGQDALVGFSSGASTDDDGLPHTPPDLPFLAPALKASQGSSSQSSSRASSRSRPPSTVLEIALAESSLSPFAHRNLSRSPSPPPSPQLSSPSSSSTRQVRHRSLPAGFEHIPWISDDDDSDVEGRLSRSLSPPLHDLLSLPPLSPDVDDGVDAAALSPSSTTSDLPPSPPRTPSPRRRFASLSGASSAEHDLPWATSPERAPPSPDRSRSSPSPRRRSSTRSGLPTLRSQLSPPHPSPTSTSTSPSASGPVPSSSSPNKPVRPTLLRESTSTSTSTSRRPTLPVSQAPSPPPSPRSRAALQLPTPDDVRARHAATRASERGRSRAVERDEGSSAIVGDGLQLSFSSPAAVEAHERGYEHKRQGDVAAAHEPVVAAEGDELDPHSLDYFERHCHSLSLLRLRHALSVATVLASLPPSAPPSPPSSSSDSESSPSRSSSSRHEPLVAHVPGLSSATCAPLSPSAAASVGRPPSSRPSSSSTPLGAANNMVSQQYRLYAMGRAKAQRTGGVGYWEGGLAAWELLLMD